MGDIMADDENTAKAPSYTLVGLFTGYKYNYHNFTVDLFGRGDNLFDKEYVGSVIVNESNGRYYEPAPGRNYGVGINIAGRFELLSLSPVFAGRILFIGCIVGTTKQRFFA
mgnify:CR=1 FL=1